MLCLNFRNLSLAVFGLAFLSGASVSAQQQPSVEEGAAQQAPAKKPLGASWKRQCEGAAGSEGELCFIQQQVVVGNKVVMVGTFGLRGAKREPVGVITVPLNTLLKSGLALRIDKKDQINFQFDVCTRQGCRVEVPLTSEFLEDLSAGNFLHIGWREPNSKNNTLRFGLDGFKSAWASVANPK